MSTVLDEIFYKVNSGLEKAIVRSVIFCLKECTLDLELKNLVNLLHGYQSNFIKENEIDKLRTFSMLSFLSKENIEKILKSMKKYELLRSARKYNKCFIKLTNKGVNYFNDPIQTLNILSGLNDEEFIVVLSDIEKKLYDKLSTHRYNIALETKMNIYMVCKNKTLQEICLKKPRDKSELIKIYGIAEKFIEKHGDGFQNILDAFYLENKI